MGVDFPRVADGRECLCWTGWGKGQRFRKGKVKVIGATLRGAGARLSAKTASSTVCMLSP